MQFERATNLDIRTFPAMFYTKCYAFALFSLVCLYVIVSRFCRCVDLVDLLLFVWFCVLEKMQMCCQKRWNLAYY